MGYRSSGSSSTPAEYSSDAVITVTRGSTAADSGAALVAAYAQAKLLRPGGSALSSTNRALLIVPPGEYRLAKAGSTDPGLLLDGQYVDLLGLGRPRIWSRSSTDDDSASRLGPTVLQSAIDVRLTDLCFDAVGIFSFPIFWSCRSFELAEGLVLSGTAATARWELNTDEQYEYRLVQAAAFAAVQVGNYCEIWGGLLPLRRSYKVLGRSGATS